jgi:hypothetical protein
LVMRRAGSGGAYRVVTPGRVRAEDGLAADYASSFEIVRADVAGYSAEQWARATFEGAPAGWRWALVFGWRAVLWLRLGPRHSPDHVLGWEISATTPSTLTLQARSVLVTAHKVVEVGDGRLTVSTLVRYERRWARPVWSALAPIHHVVEPRLITRAATHAHPPPG